MLSMTGYGFSEGNEESVDITVEIKSVNNRYCDINVKMPYFLNPYEKEIKNLVLKKTVRGKVDVNILIRDNDPNYDITGNINLASKYKDCYEKVAKGLGLNDEVRLSYFLKSDGVFIIKDNRDGERFYKLLKKYLESALKQFYDARQTEGKETERHILECLDIIDENLSVVKKESKEFSKEYEEKLRERIKDLLESNIDDTRILMEAAIIATKTDIAEEMERLASHIKQFKKECKKKEAVGRKLDFISQEMNREINTIGSKASSIKISENVIEMKTQLEKIKEQIRNIE
jgi:uncharacterized protein (TIGR00255 family)